MALGAADFGDFFAAANAEDGVLGPRPFLWQQRLVEEVCATGEWPDLVDVPTGAGKTAVVDAAVFAQAVLPEAMPRRIVYVVDRRIIVSQAAMRARRIAQNLRGAGDGVLAAVADRLRARAAAVGGTAPPLLVAELRGGIPRDATWAMRPDVPTVLTSTVDQVGSRLLFRGYGVSTGMRPVHAGLLANDVLFVLDEVHLSHAFEQLLDRITHRFRPVVDGLPDRWHVLRLSATPTVAPRRTFRLGARERAEPPISRRLTAHKPVRIQPVKIRASAKPRALRSALTVALIEAARERVGAGVPTLGVVANRVDSAVAVARALAGDGVATTLLTGRMRPYDRMAAVEPALARFLAGRERGTEDGQAVLVATQTIEAGVDLDLDALVTECASLDALRQRFGRVNRLGRIEPGEEPASVLVGAAVDGDDPVYGPALRRTWDAIGDWDDFGVGAIEARLPSIDELQALTPPPSKPPVLLPTHLDQLVQTRGIDADPEVARWLHGIDREPETDVHVVWRAEIDEEVLQEAIGDDALRDQVLDALAACPPVSAEAVAVPIHAVQRWLRRQEPASLADVEGAAEEEPARGDDGARPVLRWGGDTSGVVADPRRLRVGDTIVVPLRYGGLYAGTWDPTAREPQPDVGHEAAHAEGRAVLRLRRDLLGVEHVPDPDADEEAGRDPVEAVTEFLDDLRATGIASAAVGHLLGGRPLDVTTCRVGPAAWYVVSTPTPMAAPLAVGTPGTVDADEDDDQSFVGRAVPLQQHLKDVETWARAMADACGLSPELAGDVALAGRVHDLGKADPRFQSMLRGGVAVGPDDELLAKSRQTNRDRLARRQAQYRAGYPNRERHEALSVAFLDHAAGLLTSAHDPGLVRHLVATHHGWARPFFPAATGGTPATASFAPDGATSPVEISTEHGLADVASGIPAEFWRQVRRYGWFGEAWLAALLRLADHRASEMEQMGRGA